MHIQEQPSNVISAQSIEENSESGISTIEDSEIYLPEEIERDPRPSDVPHAPHMSQFD